MCGYCRAGSIADDFLCLNVWDEVCETQETVHGRDNNDFVEVNVSALRETILNFEYANCYDLNQNSKQ